MPVRLLRADNHPSMKNYIYFTTENTEDTEKIILENYISTITSSSLR
jgi:hypothetical protein